ncbi:hypothetical protein J7M28_12750 [bacterium]|nr:hypothetical protein [bacterium]
MKAYLIRATSVATSIRNGLVALFIVLLALTSCVQARWEEWEGRGLFPFFYNAGSWYTLLCFVNAREDSSDIIRIRFFSPDGSECSDSTEDMWSLRDREMRWFSTSPEHRYHFIPTTSNFGYVKFRTYEANGLVHAYCLIFNQATSTGFTVPAFRQSEGF